MAQQRDIESRAEALAVLALTRSPRLTVSRIDHGWHDLEVTISLERPAKGCSFGVEVIGVIRARSAAVLNERVRTQLGRHWDSLRMRVQERPRAIPLLLLVFSADSGKGFHGWLDE